MATRAIISFIDQKKTYHVYKHNDGNPESIYAGIRKALKYSWPLPRYESSDFAAAYIAANKKKKNSFEKMNGLGGGDVYLADNWFDRIDLSYRYEVTFETLGLVIKTYEPILAGDVWSWKQVSGRLTIKTPVIKDKRDAG